MATEKVKRPILKGPRIIPPRLTTKSSTDLLPLEMRLGTSKDAQPAAILKQKQMQKLDIPAPPQLRRKSSADIEAQKQMLAAQDQVDQASASLLYVHCQLNGDEAIALVNTGTVNSTIPRSIAEAYGLIGAGGKEINNHDNGAKHMCPDIHTDDLRIISQLRLGRAPFDCHLTVVPGFQECFADSKDIGMWGGGLDNSTVLLTIGMDILHRLKCILDVASRVLYIDGLSGDCKQLHTHDEVFGDTRLVRSQSSTL